jgi:hypothetical protein
MLRGRLDVFVMVLALLVSTSAVARAQVDDTATPQTQGSVADQSAAPALFLHVTSPVDQDVEVPLETVQLTVAGVAPPGAVVSVGGDLAAIDDFGNFSDSAALNEGANEIDVIASDSQGNQLTTTLFVIRGE